MPQNPPHAGEVQAVLVRTAAPSDERALATIDHETWSPQATPTPRWPRNHVFFNERTKPEDVLVAHTGPEVVGYLKLQPDPLPTSGHVQNVNGLAVAPAHQGRGVGRLLLDAARLQAHERGARRLVLRVLGNNPGARSLYRSCGYRAEGVLRDQFLLEGRYVDDIIMALDLVHE